MATKSLLLEQIRVDGGTQGREALNQDHIEDLIAAIASNAQLPPLQVFFDGEEYWLWDGFHRLEAYLQSKVMGTTVEWQRGTKRDAWIACLGANRTHGLRRSAADKRRLVQMALQDTELAQWSSRKIAEHIGVSHELVNSMRPGGGIRIDVKGRSYEHKPALSRAAASCGPPPSQKPTPDLGIYADDPTEDASQGKGAVGTESGPCIRTGSEHEWGPDEDRVGHYCCLQCGEPADEVDPPERQAATPAKIFKGVNATLGKLVREVDELNRRCPGEDYHGDILGHLTAINVGLKQWKKAI